MTVKEMITELNKCNPDVPVTVNIDGGINVGNVTKVEVWANAFEIFFNNWMLKENDDETPL